MRKLRRFLRGRVFPFAVCTLLLAAGSAYLLFRFPFAIAPALLFERLFSLCAALVAAGEPSPPEAARSRLFLLLLLPFAGAVLLLLYRTPAPLPRENEGTMSGEGLTESVRALALSAGISPCGAREIEYFSGGEAMKPRLLVDLAGAKKRIWLEFYIVAEGKFLSEICDILCRKAKEGADVRLLYDDFGSGPVLPRGFEKRLQSEGVAVKRFSPLKFPSRRAGRRDHRKIAVVDGAAYTGGINLADEYIGETHPFGHWKDCAVRVTGSATGALADVFSLAWGGKKTGDAPMREGGSPCAVLSDSAADEARLCPLLFPLLANAAKKTLYWNTPYLAPDSATMLALEGAAARGADVRLMIPHIPDKKLPFAVTRYFARRLQEAGVKVREYTAGFLHAKSVVLDGKYALVGSYNLDFRSLYMQAECAVFAESGALAEDIERDFLSAWETGTALPPARVKDKFFGGVLQLLAPLL